MDIEKLKEFVRTKPVQAGVGALALVLVAGVIAFTVYLNGQGSNKDFAVNGSRLIVVKEGMTTADIAALLHAGRDWRRSCRPVLISLRAA